MYLARIEATGFRNLSGSLAGRPGLNFLWGQNGQGKTSWLEAVAFLGGTKSFRTHYLGEVLNFQARSAHLKAEVNRRNRTETLEIHLEGSQKHLFHNGKRVPVGEYLGRLDVFVYSREEMTVVCGEPTERRRFLDRGVMSLKPAYVQTIADYNRTLKQKNALLKSVREDEVRPSRLSDLLEAWNGGLVAHGAAIHRERTAYVERLNGVLARRFFGTETLSVAYRSSLAEHGDVNRYDELLAERLRIRAEAEIAAGHALVGPHRDELDILVDGREASRFGSAGQQRSALLVLELAQLAIYRETFDEYPIFLLDDIDSELDRDRIRLLLDYLEDKAQVFVTTSKQSLADEFRSRASINRIQGGAALLEDETVVPAES